MTDVLTQIELDAIGCGNPNCREEHGALFLQSNCHPDDGLYVAYHKATGRLEITCAACQRHMASIAVAPSLAGAA